MCMMSYAINPAILQSYENDSLEVYTRIIYFSVLHAHFSAYTCADDP